VVDNRAGDVSLRARASGSAEATYGILKAITLSKPEGLLGSPADFKSGTPPTSGRTRIREAVVTLTLYTLRVTQKSVPHQPLIKEFIMNPHPKSIQIQRYIGIDIHKHYLMNGGQNTRREWTLRPRKVQVSRFRGWAEKNFQPGDAVVIETTGSVWDIYDIVAPLVNRTLVVHARKVRQIAEARVRTDKEDIKRLITLLIADIVPEVWVPPQHVRELRSLISFRWRLNKQITMSKNRLHSVVQRFNLNPPEGGLLADKNKCWRERQTYSELTGFQGERDLEIVKTLEEQKAAIDQKLAELSNTEPWASDMVYMMQIPGFGLIFSMVVLSAIGDMSRFSHPKKLVGYAGLGAGVHASGEKYQEKSITNTEGTQSARDARSCAGPWWRLPGEQWAAILIGGLSSNGWRNGCTATKS